MENPSDRTVTSGNPGRGASLRDPSSTTEIPPVPEEGIADIAANAEGHGPNPPAKPRATNANGTTQIANRSLNMPIFNMRFLTLVIPILLEAGTTDFAIFIRILEIRLDSRGTLIIFV
jgi:hypothetical protein